MALQVPPSDFWSGIDGSWSTFVLQVGTPPVAVDVLISTSQPVEYVVVPEGCTDTKNTSCASARGNLFEPKNSSTWQFKGWYSTEVAANLGYDDKGEYGFDTVALGYQGSGGPSLGNQIVTGIATNDFYLGLFGLLPKPFNFTNYNDPYPSYLQTLKSAGEIPSISWAYTAGARYRVNGVYASLTLGGYDASRFDANSVTVPMNSDITKYLSIGVQEINLAGTPSDGGNALSSGITMQLDSTLPYIWLPRDACDKVAAAFNLDYDDDTELYTVSDSVRQGLLADPPTVNFVLGADPSGGDTVQISLPYQALDLSAQSPLVNSSTNYFPIKRAANDSQYVLGRAFFQEAYIIADFERSNFSVSQTRFESNARATITSIDPPSSPTPITKPKGGGSSNTGAIAGAVVGVVVVLAILALLAFCLFRRRKRRRQDREDAATNGVPTKPEGDNGYYDSPHDHVPPYSPVPADMAELPTKYPNELEANESHPGTPKLGYYSPAGATTTQAAKHQNGIERSRSPLSELEARQVHELPAEGAPGEEEIAKPLHLRTVSRDEIRSTSIVSPSPTGASPIERGLQPNGEITRDDLPDGFVRSPGRGRASEEVSPVGSRTMSPLSRRTVSSDSIPIILDRPDD